MQFEGRFVPLAHEVLYDRGGKGAAGAEDAATVRSRDGAERGETGREGAVGETCDEMADAEVLREGDIDAAACVKKGGGRKHYHILAVVLMGGSLIYGRAVAPVAVLVVPAQIAAQAPASPVIPDEGYGRCAVFFGEMLRGFFRVEYRGAGQAALGEVRKDFRPERASPEFGLQPELGAQALHA